MGVMVWFCAVLAACGNCWANSDNAAVRSNQCWEIRDGGSPRAIDKMMRDMQLDPPRERRRALSMLPIRINPEIGVIVGARVIQR